MYKQKEKGQASDWTAKFLARRALPRGDARRLRPRRRHPLRVRDAPGYEENVDATLLLYKYWPN